jgi:hypothetical protein
MKNDPRNNPKTGCAIDLISMAQQWSSPPVCAIEISLGKKASMEQPILLPLAMAHHWRKSLRAIAALPPSGSACKAASLLNGENAK